MTDTTFVDEAICRIIARAQRWQTIDMAVTAHQNATRIWESMEAERRMFEQADMIRANSNLSDKSEEPK